jgi:hypothetical protein
MKIPNGLAEIVAMYGKPWTPAGTLDKTWLAENVVKIAPPYPMYYDGQPVSTIYIHKLCAGDLTAILTQIWATARTLVKQKVGYDKTTAEYDVLTKQMLHGLGLDQFGGTFNFRLIRGSNTHYSTHAFAIAIDIDPSHNPLGATTWRMPAWVIKIFNDKGWLSGTQYKGRKDAMHFQRCTGY